MLDDDYQQRLTLSRLYFINLDSDNYFLSSNDLMVKAVCVIDCVFKPFVLISSPLLILIALRFALIVDIFALIVFSFNRF